MSKFHILLKKELLSYYEGIHAGYLHAYSEAGTEFLLKELDVQKNDTILELGFGTGSTLVKIKARYPDIRLCGVERSEGMLRKASARLKFCHLKNINLRKTEPGGKLPFEENTFDTIYTESVLGIQEGKDLEFMFQELFRVLKPGGRFVFNETIWLDNISADEIKKINTLCKSTFGIIQASAEYPYTKDWEQLARSTGFSNISINKINSNQPKERLTVSEKLSQLFTFIGRIKALNPLKRRDLNRYTQTMNSLYGSKHYMDGYLFSMSK